MTDREKRGVRPQSDFLSGGVSPSHCSSWRWHSSGNSWSEVFSWIFQSQISEISGHHEEEHTTNLIKTLSQKRVLLKCRHLRDQGPQQHMDTCCQSKRICSFGKTLLVHRVPKWITCMYLFFHSSDTNLRVDASLWCQGWLPLAIEMLLSLTLLIIATCQASAA